MLSHKLNFWIAALLLSALFCAGSAMAEVRHAESYETLTAVPLEPGHAPRFVNGVSDLSAREGRHHEKLPLQLEGAMTKIKKSKYSPSGLSRDVPTDF
jgi:hypothetical protein